MFFKKSVSLSSQLTPHSAIRKVSEIVEKTCAPGDEQCCVMVRGMTVILDILCLLPHTEVVESGGSIEAHRGSFLSQKKRN